jgi:Ca2+-binding EF-hand superfamily protein
MAFHLPCWGVAMTTRALLTFSSLSMVLVGVAWNAMAETKMPGEPTAAKDKAVVESAFTRFDGNNDGKLTREEVARLPAIGTKFDELDKDKDGSLSLEEFAAVFITAN